jgi:hypothetical protein
MGSPLSTTQNSSSNTDIFSEQSTANIEYDQARQKLERVRLLCTSIYQRRDENISFESNAIAEF